MGKSLLTPNMSVALTVLFDSCSEENDWDELGKRIKQQANKPQQVVLAALFSYVLYVLFFNGLWCCDILLLLFVERLYVYNSTKYLWVFFFHPHNNLNIQPNMLQIRTRSRKERMTSYKSLWYINIITETEWLTVKQQKEEFDQCRSHILKTLLWLVFTHNSLKSVWLQAPNYDFHSGKKQEKNHSDAWKDYCPSNLILTWRVHL